jgi:hypothetical protein
MINEMYKPHGVTELILARAWDLVNSVPYHVSARWLFYRLFQEGFYSKKSEYGSKFLKAISAARRSFYMDWRPDTLADETREVINRGGRWEDIHDWLNTISNARCDLDKWIGQPVYVECWFEARAMTDQFKHYTKNITLRPMGGQPSIPYKWQAAQELRGAYIKYRVPIVILYFGDLDTAGELISGVIARDVQKWCDVDFAFIRCGLNLDQVIRYNVQENPEKPGDYQWEALSDQAAQEIITSNITRYLRQDAFTEVEKLENMAESWLKDQLKNLAVSWKSNE